MHLDIQACVLEVVPGDSERCLDISRMSVSVKLALSKLSLV